MKRLLYISLAVTVLFVSCSGGGISVVSSGGDTLTHADTSDSSGFVMLAEVIPDVILEMRYYSTYNFVGTRIDGYEAPVALCSREAAAALSKAAETLRQQGYRLKIFDAYRPQQGVDHFMRWAKDLTDTVMKPYFYPEISKNQILPQQYVARHSGHTRGSTFDLTLFDDKTGREVDMGGTFDYFGERSHYLYQSLTPQQRQHRSILREAMVNAGFKPLPHEWWHFTLRNEPYPDTYFTFPVNVL